MTNREFYESVVSANISEELTAKAQSLLAQMTKERDAAKSRRTSKASEANAPLMEALYRLLSDGEGRLASEIATALEVSTSKASALGRAGVKEGRLSVCDVHIKNKGNLKMYSLINEDEEER